MGLCMPTKASQILHQIKARKKTELAFGGYLLSLINEKTSVVSVKSDCCVGKYCKDYGRGSLRV